MQLLWGPQGCLSNFEGSDGEEWNPLPLGGPLFRGIKVDDMRHNFNYAALKYLSSKLFGGRDVHAAEMLLFLQFKDGLGEEKKSLK